MSDDPWNDLVPPKETISINARRIDEKHRWHFYWGCDSDRRSLLVLRHDVGSAPRNRLPRLKGIEVFDRFGTGTDKPALVLRLLDPTLRDIFYRLCIDIINATSSATSEPEAVAMAVARTWRWHHLLRGGGSELLSAQDQMGLVAELIVLERYVLSSVSPTAAVASWLGPLGAPQDFVVGRTAIESKGRGISEASNVRINSEYQLDDAGLDELFLHLCVFESTTADQDGFTVSDVASRIRARLSTDNQLAERYDSLLAAAGFRYEDDYSNYRWRGGERSIYHVKDAFPRLIAPNMLEGISRVRYDLHLPTCGSFLVSQQVLSAALTGERNAD